MVCQSSLIKQNLSKQLFMQLINTVTIINNLEPTHHIARQIRLILIPHLLANGILIRPRLPHFNIKILLRFHPPLERGYRRRGIKRRLTERDGHFFRVFLEFLLLLLFEQQQFGEVGDEVLERERGNLLGRGFEDGGAGFADYRETDEDLAQELVHSIQ